MTMLADNQAVEQVVFGENGIVSALPKGAVHISCSTISWRWRGVSPASNGARAGILERPGFRTAGRCREQESAGGCRRPAGNGGTLPPVFDAIGRQTFVAGSEPFRPMPSSCAAIS